ncbi:hypothetical protein [Emticicia sp. 21SJ11W-3]|uniref:hypothetical protein n=1 Tax=Emticicia sp. 21SJ11W-3 TaxID=2916755 RepID=UPI0020A10935|nr:hypothetical protein [Emticicia sp. 21SJ11W-3]UTA67272.1 hypothetical protein MB380_16910 [Emticicia sp. 21SJ11W-3]
MKNLIKSTMFSLFSILFFVGCTNVRVHRVTNNSEKGVRYYLGKPFIQVTPSANGDGTYSVAVVYLPNQDEQYAVEVKTFLAKSTMEISVDANGILKKIDRTDATDNLVSETIKSSGEILKAELERQNTDNEKKEKELNDKKAKAKESLDKIDSSIKAKELELKIADKDKSTLDAIANPTPEIKEKIRQVEVLIFKLREEIYSLKIREAAAKSVVVSLGSAANDPTFNKAWGPVFFAIEDTYDPYATSANKGGVKLVAQKFDATNANSTQLQFDTIGEPETTTTPDANTPKITAESKSQKIKFDSQGKAVLKILFDKEIKDVVKSQLKISNVDDNTNLLNTDVELKLLDDKKTVTITFNKPKAKEGKYKIDVTFKHTADEKSETVNVTIE